MHRRGRLRFCAWIFLLLFTSQSSLCAQILDTSDFPERWHCGNWTAFHGWAHIIADFVVWLAYTSIPIALLVIVRRKRSVLPYPFLWVMFSGFIIFCGLTHLMESIIFWWPAYRLLGVLKVMTAIISAATALMLLPRLGEILSLKSERDTEKAILDATERMRSEKDDELAQQYVMLGSIIEDSFGGYWDWHIAEGKEYLSEKFLAMFGYGAEELADKPGAWMKLLPDQEKQHAQLAYARHVESRGGQPYDLTLRFRHRAGHTVHVIRRGRVVSWDESGAPLRMVGYHVDVSRLVVTEEALAARNQLLEMMAGGINAGIWDWNLEKGTLWWSPRFYELLGYSNGEIPSDYDVLVEQVLHPTCREAMETAVQNYFRNGVPYRLNLKMRTKSGEYRWFDATGQAIFNASGEPLRMVGSIIDIHKRKELEARDKKSIAMLNDQNQRLVSFAHIISHNLRSSSGNMVALMDMMALEFPESAESETIGHLKKCAVKLHETVEHLTNVVKIQTEVNQELVPVSFSDVLQKVKQTIGQELDDLSVDLKADFSAVESVEYVPSYMESIFLNMLSNAIQYRRPDASLCIKIHTTQTDGCIQLIFEDNGQGIDLEKHGNKLFGLYKTFHNNPEARGVGLFLVKNQIEALNGKIDAQSEPGAGTTFTITF